MKKFFCVPAVILLFLATPAALAGYDCHFTILNKTAGKVDLVFWGASGDNNHWAPATDPVKLFTGTTPVGVTSFDPFPAQGGAYDIGHARKGLNVSGKSRLLITEYAGPSPGPDDDDFDFGLETDSAGRFVLSSPAYSFGAPFGLLPEYFGNDKDLFAVALDNRHYIWAGMLLHNAGNDDGGEAWTKTLRSLIYTYYYKYAYGADFLFKPPGSGGWYVHTGGGSDDLLWAALAAIGYKELSGRDNNGMDYDVYRHQNRTGFGDSNRGFCGEYITLDEHRKCFGYLDPSGCYYAGEYTPNIWYGITWKDHITTFLRGLVDYKSSMGKQNYTGEDGLNFRASISNGLFWLYAARLLKHRARLGLSDGDAAALARTVANEYDLFFGAHNDLYVCHANEPQPDPANPLDRVGLIRDGANYPCLAYLNGNKSALAWEQLDDDFNTWTYNTGVVLGCLGESYLADPSPANAHKYFALNGFELAVAALDRLSWQTDDNAPAGVPCEIENEVRGLEANSDMIVFKGAFALFIGDFAEALQDVIMNGNLEGKSLENAKMVYKRISGVIRGTSNFLAAEWELNPPAPWVWRDSPYLTENPGQAASNSITQGSAAAAHVTAGRLREWDRTLVNSGKITDPDEYLICALAPEPE